MVYITVSVVRCMYKNTSRVFKDASTLCYFDGLLIKHVNSGSTERDQINHFLSIQFIMYLQYSFFKCRTFNELPLPRISLCAL